MEIIVWVGFSQGLFAAIIMLAKRDNSISDRILSAWLTLLAIEFLFCGLDFIFFGYPILSSSFLLFNPAFYLYVRSLVEPDFKLKPIQLLHLSPFLFLKVGAYVLHVPFVLKGFLNVDSAIWFRLVFAVATMVSWVAYNFITFLHIYRHRARLLNEYSSIESNKRIDWLLFVVVFYNLYCLVLVVTGILNVFVDIEYPLSPLVNYSALLLFAYILGYYGIQQELIYRNSNGDFVAEEEKASTSILSPEQTLLVKNKLLDYFHQQKPYLNPDLNMGMLSKALGYPKHHITEVLNKEIGKNFFQFVNFYRVEAVKEMLASRKKNFFSIEAIGYECGFNSKSSFFTTFKKETGQTPLQFKSENQ